jgi:hypothetical protein
LLVGDVEDALELAACESFGGAHREKLARISHERVEERSDWERGR